MQLPGQPPVIPTGQVGQCVGGGGSPWGPDLLQSLLRGVASALRVTPAAAHALLRLASAAVAASPSTEAVRRGLVSTCIMPGAWCLYHCSCSDKVHPVHGAAEKKLPWRFVSRILAAWVGQLLFCPQYVPASMLSCQPVQPKTMPGSVRIAADILIAACRPPRSQTCGVRLWGCRGRRAGKLP